MRWTIVRLVSAAHERATANVAEGHLVGAAAAPALHDDTARRDIDDARAAQAVILGDVFRHARIAAATRWTPVTRRTAVTRRRWRGAAPVRWGRTTVRFANNDIHLLQPAQRCRPVQQRKEGRQAPPSPETAS